MYLVIDTWVWEKAQRAESPEALELLAKVWRKCEHKIIYDCEGKILDEYIKHIKAMPIVFMFRIMTQTGKMVPRPIINLNLEGFDKSDMKFVQVAISTPGTIIISGDSDFLEIRKRLKEDERLRSIKILSPAEALHIL